MKIIIYVIIILCSVIMSCSVSQQNNSDKLSKTIWNFEFGHDNLSSFFSFIDDRKYKFYDAETGNTTFGTYFFRNDTVFLNQEYGAYDNEFPEDSRHRTQKLHFKMLIINNNQLGFIEQWDCNNKKWVDNYFFVKENN